VGIQNAFRWRSKKVRLDVASVSLSPQIVEDVFHEIHISAAAGVKWATRYGHFRNGVKATTDYLLEVLWSENVLVKKPFSVFFHAITSFLWMSSVFTSFHQLPGWSV